MVKKNNQTKRQVENLKSHQWAKGVSGNLAGRPPKLGSIRNQIRDKLQEIIPCQLCNGVGQITGGQKITIAQAIEAVLPSKKIRGAMKCPTCNGKKLDPHGRTFAEWIATQEIYKAAAGEDRAIENVIDQVDGKVPQPIEDVTERIPMDILLEALEDAE